MINIINLSYKENGTLNDAYYLKEINLNLPSYGLVIFTSDDKKSYLSLIKILVGLYPATKESKIIIDISIGAMVYSNRILNESHWSHIFL